MRSMYWFLSSFFFFLAAVIFISILKPGPSEVQVMQWMHGMMDAMHSSLMGASMDGSENFRALFELSARVSLLTLLLGTAGGIFVKLWRKT